MDSNYKLRVGENQNYLREKYNYVNGHFFKKRLGKSDLQIGSIDYKGYVRTKIQGGRYSVHRLIWIWHYGSTEDKVIDHINGVRNDNRIENLRLATLTENQHNRKVSKNSTTGVKGVYLYSYDNDRYTSHIKFNNKQFNLGIYETLAEATAAYKGAATLVQGEFRYR